MAENQESSKSENAVISRKKALLISALILLAGGVITIVIFFFFSLAERETATRKTAMLVEVTEVKSGTFRPAISATGTVKPEKDIVLSPRISGAVIYRSPAFSPGGFVRKGEVLVRIDPADYENELNMRLSALRQARADLAMEMGRQQVAQKDFELLNDSLQKEQKALVLREPQLNAEKARVDAALADVQLAELRLERTTIRAPFDAHILSRNVNEGSLVSPGDNMGRLVGVENYWVEVAVPPSSLRWLSFPEQSDDTASTAVIHDQTAWPEGAIRTGKLYRMIGNLEDNTRLARVLVTVPDPLALEADSTETPSLMIGAFVETKIEGKELRDVFRLDRDYIRNDETVWVMEDGKLRIREVDIAFRDPDYAYITSGINENAKVVITNLSTVVDGAGLRLEGDSSVSPSEGTDSSNNQSSGGQQ